MNKTTIIRKAALAVIAHEGGDECFEILEWLMNEYSIAKYTESIVEDKRNEDDF